VLRCFSGKKPGPLGSDTRLSENFNYKLIPTRLSSESNHHPEPNAEKRETGVLDVEVVTILEYDRECLKHEIQDAE
jgi:hypothetical protein